MKTLKKIKLNGLNDAELRDREMDALNGGDRTCGGSVVILGGLSFVNSLHAYTFAGSADFPGWQAFF